MTDSVVVPAPTPTPPQGLPIAVDPTPADGQLAVALRQLLMTAGGAATVLGASHLGTFLGQAALLVGPIVAVASIIIGQLRERRTNAKEVFMANKLPDHIAFVKGSPT